MLFKKGDWVLLKIEKRRIKSVRGHSKFVKLAPRYYGPFCIDEAKGPNHYLLDLPPHWKMHPVVNISLLKPFKGDPPSLPNNEEEPELIDEAEELVPEQIVFHRVRKGRYQYLTKFKNYPAADAMWLEEDNFQEFPELLKLYQEAMKIGVFSP